MAATASPNTDTSAHKCPKRARRDAAANGKSSIGMIHFADLHREPFRIFFPAATIAGLVGVGLWPALLLGWTENYPGGSHARLMMQGFFGGFVIGFMGTAMPKLVDARPFSAREAFGLLGLFLTHLLTASLGFLAVADAVFIAEIVLLFTLLRRRCHASGSMPPPSFSLVGLGLLSAGIGAAIHLAGKWWELSPMAELIARFTGYHAFILLSILGAGGFLLPRFLGLGVRRSYQNSSEESPEWRRAARIARTAGFAILSTYVVEAFGWSRVATTARALIAVAYLAYEMPVERLRWNWKGVHWLLLTGLLCIPVGMSLAGWFPGARLAFLHVELIGGFALITIGVATRVVFGHTGVRERLDRFHPWLAAAAVLMLLGLMSRLVGDLVPAIQNSHYLYAALTWMAGLIVWAVCVLPRVIRADPDP